MPPFPSDSGLSCSDFVTSGCILRYLSQKNLSFGAHLTAESSQPPCDLLLELIFLLVSGHALSERVLARLADAERSEPDVWLRDDIRIAWLTVLYCANGKPTPWEWAFNRVVGGQPSKVIPQLVERARKHAMLGLPPKKKSVSETEAIHAATKQV
jgi:hypothetical protein